MGVIREERLVLVGWLSSEISEFWYEEMEFPVILRIFILQFGE